jgi:hypothetical protein
MWDIDDEVHAGRVGFTAVCAVDVAYCLHEEVSLWPNHCAF